MDSAELPNIGMSQQVNHKNNLHDYAQRSAIPLPVYQTINEGPRHASQFRSTVVVEETTFTSSSTFSNKKAAEQDVARVALEGIKLKLRHKGVSLIQNDTTFCKSILHEYAVKMNIQQPTYSTSESKRMLLVFVTSVLFNGQTYTGGAGMNKKVSEQIAARAVIESILGNSNSGTVMSEIIKSKAKFYDAIYKDNGSCQTLNTSIPYNSTNAGVNGEEAQAAMKNGKSAATESSTTFDHEQLATAAAINSAPTAVVKPKVECFNEVSSGTFGSNRRSTFPTTHSQGDQPAIASSGIFNYGQFDTAAAINSTYTEDKKPKEENVKEVSPGPSGTNDTSPTMHLQADQSARYAGVKRSRKRKEASSKKACTNEQPCV